MESFDQIHTILLQSLHVHIVLIQGLGHEKKIAGEIRSCHENAHEKSFETSPHMIWLALSLKILMALG